MNAIVQCLSSRLCGLLFALIFLVGLTTEFAAGGANPARDARDVENNAIYLESDRKLADEYFRQKKLRDAFGLYKQCLDEVKQLHGDNSQYADRILDRLADLAIRLGKPQECERYLVNLWDIRVQVFAPGHKECQSLLLRLDPLLKRYRASMKSADYSRLQTWMLQRSADKVDRERRLNGIYEFSSTLLNGYANFDGAAPLLQVASRLDDNAERRSFALHYLSYWHTLHNRFAEAVPLAEESISIRERSRDYRGLISSLELLAQIKRGQYKPDEAYKLYTRAVTVWEKLPDSADKTKCLDFDRRYAAISLAEYKQGLASAKNGKSR